MKRQLNALASAAFILVSTAACSSFPTHPLWWPSKSPHSTAPSSPQFLACPEPLTQSGKFQAGIAVYWDNGTMSDSAVQRQSAAVIRYALSLHANSIMVSFPFFVSGARSSAVEGVARWTPSPGQLSIFLTAARHCHVNVTVKPLLSETNLQPGWRGSIKPSSPAAWFRSYERFILPYLRISQANRSIAFVLGTELNSLLRYHTYWSRIYRIAKATYRGRLAYDGYARKPARLLRQADLWPSLHLPANAGQRELDAAWKALLHRSRSLRGVVISELGMAAVPGAYAHPAHWFGIGTPTRAARAMQARWFIAACRATLSVHAAGIYWWKVSFSQLASSQHGDQFSFYNTPAQHAVSECFDGGLR